MIFHTVDIHWMFLVIFFIKQGKKTPNYKEIFQRKSVSLSLRQPIITENKVLIVWVDTHNVIAQ